MSEDSEQNAQNGDTLTIANPFDDHDAVNVDTWQPPEADSALITGLLRQAKDRAGESGYKAAVALMRGQTRKMAAIAAGILPADFSRWLRQDRTLADIMGGAEAVGFSQTLESEAYKRAMAGPEDRGSMRALEMLLKARSPDYREKAQIQMDVVHKAESADAGVVDGWSDDAS